MDLMWICTVLPVHLPSEKRGLIWANLCVWKHEVHLICLTLGALLGGIKHKYLITFICFQTTERCRLLLPLFGIFSEYI